MGNFAQYAHIQCIQKVFTHLDFFHVGLQSVIKMDLIVVFVKYLHKILIIVINLKNV